MNQNSIFSKLVFIAIFGAGAARVYFTSYGGVYSGGLEIAAVTFVLAYVMSAAVLVADQRNRAVLLPRVTSTRLGGRGSSL